MKLHEILQKNLIEYFAKPRQKGGSGYFKIPEAYIVSDVETVPGIDGQKMIELWIIFPLFSEDEEIRKLVMSIVTDSGSVATDGSDPMAGIPSNVFNIHKLFIGNSGFIQCR